MKVSQVLLAAGLVVAGATEVRADEAARAIQRVIGLDQRVHIMALEFNEAPLQTSDVADRKIIDAEGLLGLHRRDEAVDVLLEVVAKWPLSRAAQDARFLLGDGLFELYDYHLARSYYHEALASFSGTRREQHALERLIEIALRTGEFEDTERTLALLSRTRGAALEPAVIYVKAKLLYYRGQLDEAAALFGSIPPTSRYQRRARYLLGAVLVKQDERDGASVVYEEIVRSVAGDDEDREIQDLARLALARLDGARGRLDGAAAWYRAVAPGSKAGPDALYELGWTEIRAKHFEKAYQAFDRLLRSAPSGAQAPELKVLLANLHLRLGELNLAAGVFDRARSDVEPSYRKLRAAIAHGELDPIFLDSLNHVDFKELDLSAFVPPETLEWVRADPQIDRLLRLASDVGGIEQSNAKAQDTLQRIERVIAETDPLVLFPDLAGIRARSTEALAELVAVRDPFARRVREMERPHLAEAEARGLEESAAERAGIEQQLGARSSPSVLPRYALGPGPARAQVRRDDASNPVSELRAAVLQLGDPRDGTRFGVAEARRADEAGTVTGAPERALATRLQQLAAEEERLRELAETRMSPSERREIVRDLEVISRADAAAAQLLALDSRLDGEASRRVTVLEGGVTARRREALLVDRQVTTVVGQAQILGGSLTRVMYTRIANRFYDLMVRADVGLIDVSWARKDRSTQALQTFLKKKNLEVDALQDELRRQEDALSQRFEKEAKWEHAQKLDPAYRPPEH